MRAFFRYNIFLVLLFSAKVSFGIPDSIVVIKSISIKGNKVTKPGIILRELTLREGDTISSNRLSSEISRSHDNIMNTSLFNFVEVDHEIIAVNLAEIHISVTERWYVWPVPIFEHAERNLGAFLKDPNWERLNYGLALNWSNFRGRRETLFLKARFGYREQYAINYDKPNIGAKQRFGMTATMSKFRMHEVPSGTRENLPVYMESNDRHLMEDFSSFITLSYRNYLYYLNSISLFYSEVIYRDSATHELFLGNPYNEKSRFFSLEYMMEYDIRDSKYYPLTGEYLRLNLRFRGLGLIPDYDNHRTSLLVNAMYSKKWSERFFHNQAFRMYISKDTPDPAFYRSGIGYVTYLRGYELNVVDATSFGVMSNNVKYCIMPERVFNIPLIPWSQFNKAYLSIYGNLFFDAGYGRNTAPDPWGNTLRNKLLYSGGAGIDFVTYYDQVLRFEVSLNREGNFGFFIHNEVPFARW